MPNSYITKNALANSLKKIMLVEPFEKINITEICDDCNMSRKSFYYHFKDKYDLVNWIFKNEFLDKVHLKAGDYTFENHWDFLLFACQYFYDNRKFYKKVLQIKGQNSFSDYLKHCMHPLLKNRLSYMFKDDNVDEFTVDLFADFTLCAIEHWLLNEKDIPPETFIDKLRTIICNSTVAVYNELDKLSHK